MGLIPEGLYKNQAAYEKFIDVNAENFEQSDLDMLYDAQTSGGLLMAVGAESAEELLSRAKSKGFNRAAVIGEFVNGTGKIKIL